MSHDLITKLINRPTKPKRSGKKFIAFALCLILFISAVSCAGNPDAPTNEPQNESSSATVNSPKTIQTLSFGGIDFSIPSYYEGSVDLTADMKGYTYTSDTGEPAATMLFLDSGESVSEQGFESQKSKLSELVDTLITNSDEDAVILETVEITVAGLPTWMYICSSPQTTSAGFQNTYIFFTYNLKEEKIPMFLFSYNADALSNYDLWDDYSKMLDTAILSPKTNQTLSYGGIDFSIPSYYEVGEDLGWDMKGYTYLLDSGERGAIMIFMDTDVPVSQDAFDNFSDAHVSELLGQDAEILKTTEVTIAGLSAKIYTCYSPKRAFTESGNAYIAFAYKPKEKKVITFMFGYDDIAESNYDLWDDYSKMLTTATLSPKTIQTLSFGGIDFSIPSYYDVADNSTKDEKHYTYILDSGEPGAMMAFAASGQSMSQQEFDSITHAQVSELLGQRAVILKTIEHSIAGLSARTYICYLPEPPIAGFQYMNFSYIYNPKQEKVIMPILGYDDYAGSDYNLLDDYSKMLDNATLSANTL